MKTVKKQSGRGLTRKCSFSFEAANIESLYPVLDALAFLEASNVTQISQFAGIDPRTAGKHLKNCEILQLIGKPTEDTYLLTISYPYKGTLDQKKAIIREAIFQLPLMRNLRQFLNLEEKMDDALRKAATIAGITNFESKSFSPLIKWATQLNALDPKLLAEDLINEAVKSKELRHKKHSKEITVFISHSSKDKSFVRQLAGDLATNGVTLWLDEQTIRVGDSIVDKINQGLASSDFFLAVLSDNSISSEWVKRELNQALIREIEERRVKILPIKLTECEMPSLIKDKKYADFSKSYKQGLVDLLKAMKEE